MQEDYPGDNEHGNYYLNPDFTDSDSSDSKDDDILAKPEPQLNCSKCALCKTVVPAQKERSQVDTTVLPQSGLRTTSAVSQHLTKRI
jgi:hypothetical protein